MFNFKIKTVAGLVFRILWLVLALLCFIVGLVMIMLDGEPGKFFESWLAWGGVCCIPTIGQLLRTAFATAKDGARRGANDYTVTVSSDSVSVQNHPIRDAILGFFVGGFIGVLFGPIYLAIATICVIVNVIKFFVNRSKQKKAR